MFLKETDSLEGAFRPPNNSLEPRRSARTFGRHGGLPSIPQCSACAVVLEWG
jgi:hypothetical protein